MTTAAASPAPAPARPAAPRRGKLGRVALIAVGLIAISAASVAAFHAPTKSRVLKVWHSLVGSEPHESASGEAAATTGEPPQPFDGLIRLTPEQAQAIGLTVEPARAQTEPMRLSVMGRTAYDPNSLNRVRPKFKSLIDRVYVAYGQTVKQGDPLVDLFSADLAEAKGVYETKMAQWEHDRAELARSAELLKTKATSNKDHLSVVNDEKKSGTEAKVAKDKLLVLGLSEAEVAQVPTEDGTRKAKMTLHAPASGVVIAKDMVAGNIYDDADVLLTIAPLDHLLVYGYVYPSDASRVAIGESWVVDCPFVGKEQRRTIESVTSEIDKETKTIVIRTRIENPTGRLKADMLVGGYVEIPPPSGSARTRIPREAMISLDGGDYVFVDHPPTAGEASPGGHAFERRRVRPVQESSERVILAEREPGGEGVSPGDPVAVKGSLLLMQMLEDAGGDTDKATPDRP